jgi:hypothetical protein
MARTTSVLLALFELSCAPLASMRPAGELASNDRRWEVGGAAIGFGPRPYVIESWQTVGQIWGTARMSSSIDFSAIVTFDDSAAAAGGALRWTPLRLGPLAGGVEAEFGYSWAALSLPLGVRVAQPVWLYAAPRLGTQGIHLTPGVPAGISVETLAGLMLRGEAQLSWARFQAYERRLHLALGLAHQW